MVALHCSLYCLPHCGPHCSPLSTESVCAVESVCYRMNGQSVRVPLGVATLVRRKLASRSSSASRRPCSVSKAVLRLLAACCAQPFSWWLTIRILGSTEPSAAAYYAYLCEPFAPCDAMRCVRQTDGAEDSPKSIALLREVRTVSCHE